MRTGIMVSCAAYDGFPSKAGRIVADSSFHHFLDINLRNLSCRDASGLPVIGSDLDQIAHFYGNLALWLPPPKKRIDMKLDLLLRLAKHPDVIEVMGNSLLTTGKTANAVLRTAVGKGKLHTFLGTSAHEGSHVLDEVFSLIFLGESSKLPVVFERPDVFLGAAIDICHKVFRVRTDNISSLKEDSSVLSSIHTQITELVKSQLHSFGDMFP